MSPLDGQPEPEPDATDRGVRPAVDFVVGGHWRKLGGMALTAFLGGVAEAVFLVTVTRAAFAITDGDDRVGIVWGWYLSVDWTLALALGLVVLRFVLASFAVWQSAALAARVVADVRHRLAAAFLRSSWEVQQAQRSGGLQELRTTFSQQASSLMNGVAQSVLTGANLVALIVIAVAVDPIGALVLVVSVGLLGLLLRPLRRAVRRRAQASSRAGMEFATSVSEIADLGVELHVFHVQDQAREHLGGLIEQTRERGRRLQFAAGVATPIYTGLAYLALLGALAVVAESDATSLTSLGAAMLVMLRSLGYGQALQTALAATAAGAAPIDVLRAKVAAFEQARTVRGDTPVGRVGPLSVERVSFSYVPGQEVLRDISFTIEPNEIVGIVGPSGSGKSTLVQLLLGLRGPDSGRVLADGRDVGDLDPTSWARKVTFVPQTAHLVAGTVAENIRFFRSGVGQVDVERAARLAHLHEDVSAFPEQYERQVGERGGHLSGGQQQRLCIARALVEDPDVLVLDEPTSALDVRSEHLIRSTLLELKERMSVIVIAHRLSTLEVCDRIMVIQDGELKGFDTPEALEAGSDFYREALVLSGMR